MKKNKLIIILIFSVFMLSQLLVNVYAAELKENQIYLKIDKYFILYTYPESPYIDKNNRVLIPESAVRDLMGGQTKYDEETKKVEISLLNHSFVFTADSSFMIADGKKIEMDTKAVLKKDVLFVPIRYFLAFTDIKWTWNQKLSLLHITEKDIALGKPFLSFAGNDIVISINDNALDLISYKLEYIGRPDKYSYKIHIRAKNILGREIAKGRADINPLTMYFGEGDKSLDGGHSVDSYSRSSDPKLSKIQTGEEFVKKTNINLKNPAYIISVGREIN